MKPFKAPRARLLVAMCAVLIATGEIGTGPVPVNADATSPTSDLGKALVRMREIPSGRELWAFTKACGCVRLKLVDSIIARSDTIVDKHQVRQPLYGETRTTTSVSSFRARVQISRLALRDGVAPLTLYHELRHVVINHAEWRASRSRRSGRRTGYEASHARIDTYSDPPVLAFIAQVPEVRQILASKGLPQRTLLEGGPPPGDGQSPPPLPPGGGSGPL